MLAAGAGENLNAALRFSEMCGENFDELFVGPALDGGGGDLHKVCAIIPELDLVLAGVWLHLDRDFHDLLPVSPLENFELHAGCAAAYEIEFLGGGQREIDNPAILKRAAVVDADNNRFLVLKVGDPNARPERKGPVRRGQVVHIEHLAVRCHFSVVVTGIVGGDAFKRQEHFARGIPGCLRRVCRAGFGWIAPGG